MDTKKKNSRNKKPKVEKEQIDEKSFKRINEQFQRYWKYLFSLILVYIIAYLIWVLLLSQGLRKFLDRQGWGGEHAKEIWLVVLAAALIQGILFAMDGFVSALLKSPFNQMCYAINKAEGISYEKKDSIITKATESNEHCKETLKKFGILTICVEVIQIIVIGAEKVGDVRYGNYWYLLNVSYLIPITIATYRVWQIHRELNRLKSKSSKLKKRL
ncbi:MAG: hypothetical protein I3273_00280 [Candidatus Moeniiplasma glomeromycotorum]|nr:hypothetical protein [Candidatus Moeniiplasma glomeromycotorum]MCE8167434.1 hypothetical protein [Candidatus Moeniiplasma glomeromycotorum]MCE8168552.1 hypothetical protein [Candidatus Moeniiplasma glomeromycotorum]